MKTKKTLISVFTAVFIVALIIGCIAPMDNLINGDKKTAPSGKTLVRLNFTNSNSNARTVLPNTSAYNDASKFAWFQLVIHNEDTGFDVVLSSPFDDYMTYAEIMDPANVISLDDDTGYSFTVTAGTATSPRVPQAAGVTPVNLGTGEDVVIPVEITLKEIIDDTSLGTFGWSLTTGDTYTIANLSLEKLADPGTNVLTGNIAGAPISIIGNYANTDAAILSGYYKMILELGKTAHQTVFVMETVHIYSGLTSTYTKTLPALRSLLHTVTYDYTDDDAAGDMSNARLLTEDIIHGSLISSLTEQDPPHSSSLTTATHYFEGWYYEDSFTYEAFSTDFIIKPMSLYAKWAPITATTNFTITLEWEGGITLVPTGTATYTYNLDDQSTGSLVIALTAPVSSIGPYEWKSDQGDVLGGNSGTLNLNISITSGNLAWFTPGGFTITLFANDGLESGEYTFTNP